MTHWLRRHPFPVAAQFRHVLVLTYAFPEDILEPLLPPGLVLDTYLTYGFLAIAMVETQRLRPSFLSAAWGHDFFLTGYRIFSRLSSRQSALRGLYILRSDTNRRWMATLGNVFTHYKYGLCAVDLKNAENRLSWHISTPDAEADLSVTADLQSTPAPLPHGSPFPDVPTARRFAGPLPYTFDYERESNAIITVRGLRESWQPEPVKVQIDRLTYFERAPFNRTDALLASAFHLSNVPYRWERGKRVKCQG
jgi:hypothetical protein